MDLRNRLIDWWVWTSAYTLSENCIHRPSLGALGEVAYRFRNERNPCANPRPTTPRAQDFAELTSLGRHRLPWASFLFPEAHGPMCPKLDSSDIPQGYIAEQAHRPDRSRIIYDAPDQPIYWLRQMYTVLKFRIPMGVSKAVAFFGPGSRLPGLTGFAFGRGPVDPEYFGTHHTIQYRG